MKCYEREDNIADLELGEAESDRVLFSVICDTGYLRIQ